MSVASVTNMRYACNSNQACQSKTNLATQAYWAKPTKPNPPIQTKLLGKAVDAWVRSAFGNVFFLEWSGVERFSLPIHCHNPSTLRKGKLTVNTKYNKYTIRHTYI